MELRVLSSSSQGNAYILDSGHSILLIEGGVSYQKSILPACDFRRKDIVGCLISHHHKDHCGHMKELLDHGIKCLTPSDLPGFTHEQKYVEIGGGFYYQALPMKHANGDGTPCECWAFLIFHQDMGWLLFCTDTAIIPQDISLFELSHVMIAANYSKALLQENIKNGTIPLSRARHTIRGHMSIERCINELKWMNLKKCLSITLLHLSESNSCADDFQARVQAEIGVKCEIAEPGLIIDISSEPF